MYFCTFFTVQTVRPISAAEINQQFYNVSARNGHLREVGAFILKSASCLCSSSLDCCQYKWVVDRSGVGVSLQTSQCGTRSAGSCASICPRAARHGPFIMGHAWAENTQVPALNVRVCRECSRSVTQQQQIKDVHVSSTAHMLPLLKIYFFKTADTICQTWV